MPILAGRNARVLVQGITGREASGFVQSSLDLGTRIVAGVTPGKAGWQIHGVPVFNTVADAQQNEPCDATVIAVPALQACRAATEALQAGLKLLVILTERVPRRDAAIILEHAREHGAVVIGPNSLGIVSPAVIRIGLVGGSAEALKRAYKKGPVGIMSRSGGMLTEIANLLTQEGIGQSTCVSVGGDPIEGTTFADLLPHYESDEETRVVVIFCEPGGHMEEELADRLSQRKSRIPIVAFMAGRFMDRMQGVRFGHAAAIVNGNHGSPARKIERLRAAGVSMAEKISAIPELVRRVLAEKN